MIFHLAAIVSGEAEQDFDKGYRINLDGTRNLLEAIRHAGHKPRVVFSSSVAVFGAPYPEAIGDEFLSAPLTSYGTQKAIGDLLVSDYSRKGFLDGLSIRLPTICVRPGKPNKAASGFFSNIMREPLAGQEAVLPVSDSVMHWHASPRAAVGFMLHAATIDTARVGARRALNMPGLAVTVAEQIEALGKVAGGKVVARIRREIDPFIDKIVSGWPTWINRLTPIVEVAIDQPVANRGEERTTGTINPGVLWSGRYVQLGAEAIIPINGDSGDSTGFALQLHFYVDDLFPHSFGRPLFGARS